MVVASGDIGHQGTEDIERCPLTELLLKKNIGLDLIKRDMPRPFDHDLNPGFKGLLPQFPQQDQLLNLGPVGGIGQATGT
jgi:hypothetical protein